MATKKTAQENDVSLQRGREIAGRIVGNSGHRTSVDADLLNLITKYAFGDVWSRPGLDIDQRRLITLAMTIAGGHYEEFKLHLRFALANGMDRATAKEIMLHSAVYCGIPAALGAFRSADEVYRELDGKAS